jgi:hypothetical protein
VCCNGRKTISNICGKQWRKWHMFCACCTAAASRRSRSSLWMRLPSSLEGSGAIDMIMVATATFWLARGKTGVFPLPRWIWSYTQRGHAHVPSAPRSCGLGHLPSWSPLAYSASWALAHSRRSCSYAACSPGVRGIGYPSSSSPGATAAHFPDFFLFFTQFS